jgi:hypothetical protein
MWERYAWFAFPALGLCMVGGVASYMWDGDYLVWPTLFAVAGCLVMLPLVIVRPLQAVLHAMRSEQEPSSEE